MEKHTPSPKDHDSPKREESGSPKDRLKDLNVKEKDGSFIKGGIPKQPDC